MAQGTSAADKPAAAKTTTPTTTTAPPPAAGQVGGTSEGNTAVPVGDIDRVAMLTLNPDGTPRQTERVEMIGDPEAIKAGTAEQFRQQAVSAEDVRLRGVTAGPGGDAEVVEQDPSIAALQEAHQSVADDATKAAEAAVDALHTGESEQVPDTNPAAPAGS